MVFDHHVVGAGQAVKPADPKRGAFSRMEAWLWLIANAAYEPSRITNKGREMMLNPGQLMGAYAYLSDVWNWTPETTRYFLKRLELTLMITRWCDKQKESKNHNQCQVISVCNYERYQITYQSEPQAIQQAFSQAVSQANNKRATSQPQESNTLTINTKKDSSVASATLPGVDEHADEVSHSDALACFNSYNDLALKVGLPQARGLDPSRKKKILARLRDHGKESWDLLLTNIDRSLLLQGKKTSWRPPGLGWFLEPGNYVKVIEGGYGNGAHAESASDQPGESLTERWQKKLENMSGKEERQ